MSRKTQPLPVEPEQPVSSTARDTSPLTATGGVKTEKPVRAPRSKISKPNKKNTAPRLHNKTFAQVAGTYWRADGDGWELRKSGGANDPDKDKYLGRLSGKRYGQMKADFGNQLPVALTEWVKAKAAEKGIEL